MDTSEIDRQLGEVVRLTSLRDGAALDLAERLHETALVSGDIPVIVRAKMALASCYANLKGDFETGMTILFDQRVNEILNVVAKPLELIVRRIRGDDGGFIGCYDSFSQP